MQAGGREPRLRPRDPRLIQVDPMRNPLPPIVQTQGAKSCSTPNIRYRATLQREYFPVGKLGDTIANQLCVGEAVGYAAPAIKVLWNISLPPRAIPVRISSLSHWRWFRYRRVAKNEVGSSRVSLK